MQSWRDTLAVYLDRRILAVLVLGFSSGLPAPLIFGNLSIWLRDVGVSRTDIGLFALVATPYAINFLWAPLIDRMKLPWLTKRFGRRRGWILLTQAVLLGAVLVMSRTDPATDLFVVAMAALFVSTASATQDIVIDAYRIDVLDPQSYGAGSAAAIWGWHLGGTLVGGAGGLYLAQAYGWNVAYLILAFAVLIGMVAVLMSREPQARPSAETVAAEREAVQAIRRLPFLKGGLAEAAAWVYGAAVAPFLDFMKRRGWVLILLFIFIFKLGDALLGRMSGVFYREMGFGLTEIADVSKVYGMAANAAGVVLGGLLVARLGLMRSLFAAGFAAAVTNLTYSWLAVAGKDMTVFTLAVVSDNFTGGLVTVAFVAYLSSLCNVAYTATQYALLASLGNLARIWFSASAGYMVDSLDGNWSLFFMMTAIIALAGLPLLWIIMKLFPDKPSQARPAPAE
ncbi:MFS transporter [Telmatospirillum sp. J64-1]|uniref:AmpG family muropeptide MFS transporter n=1 Tax=Telmatospirillum sp. J64-1 TaxID=2502183 RepID=UPI00115E76D6|nr:MFS transporter [Telmatospirillum sp. J64-1]